MTQKEILVAEINAAATITAALIQLDKKFEPPADNQRALNTFQEIFRGVRDCVTRNQPE